MIVAFVIALLLPISGRAQSVRNLDDERFIQGLLDRGMTRLAEHFLKTFETDDPVLKLEMLSKAQKLKAQDNNVAIPERRQAYLDALETYRKLMKDAPVGHWKAPIWRTDFAEYVLLSVLRGRYTYAGDFFEYGSPSLEQEREFTALAAETAVAMDEAFNLMFQLKTDLTRREDFVDEFENTGRWDVLIKEYDELKLPFFQALAYHYASLLPKPPEVVKMDDAEAAVAGVIERGQLSGEGLGRVRALLGRIKAKLGKHDEALAVLDEAVKTEGVSPFDAFLAQLTKAQVLAAQGKKDEALKLLDEQSNGPSATEGPLLLVLVFDARFRVTQDKGEYAALLAHPTVEKLKLGEALTGYLNQRLIERNPVNVADAGAMSIEGKSALEVNAAADAVIGEANKIEDTQAKGKALSVARDLLKKLLDRGGLDPVSESNTRFKIGQVSYGMGDTVGAARAWRDLGEKLPEQKLSEGAAINAFKVADALYKQNAGSDAIGKLYEESMLTMLSKFPHASLGKDQPVSLHRYTLAGFYRTKERHQEALDHYGLISPDHPYYANATYESLLTRLGQWLAADTEAKKLELAKTLADGADKAGPVLARAKGGDAEQASKYKRMAGDTQLIKAQVQAESLGEGGKARVSLEKFEQEFGEFPELVSAKRQLLVNIYLQLGKTAEAKTEVQKFIESNPAQSGPLIKGVLDSLHRQVADAQRVNPRDPRVAELRQAGLDLSGDLLAWAKGQKEISGDPQRMIYFQTLHGQELIAAGQHAEAKALYEKLAAEGGADNIDVLLGLGQACAGVGEHEAALAHLNKIINKAPDKNADYWWQAWLTRLRVLDAQYEELEKTDAAKAKQQRMRNIYFAVEKLEKSTDPNLGGPKFKAELTRLKNKNAQ